MGTFVEIDRGIPLPEAGGQGTKRPRRFPWSSLSVGDSFLATGTSRGSLAGNAARVTKNTGMRFATREVENGIRVWRVA